MGEREHKTSYLIRLGVVTYVFALCLIAAFSIAFHFITDSIVHRQQTTARMVNVSGRQRMLSQRIAKLALERAAHANLRPDAETGKALRTAIALMEASQAELLRGSEATGGSVLTQSTVADVYLKAPWQLNVRVQTFIQNAHAVADSPEVQLSVADPSLIALEAEARDPLLNALNAAVTEIAAASERSILHLRHLLAGLTIAMLVILALEALLLYRPLFRKLAHANIELIRTGRTDSLTGCLNRRGFTREAEATLAECRASGERLSVMMVDIDRFKAINDKYGHAAGDAVINAVSTAMQMRTRKGNILCRMGGEEFAVILRGSSLTAAATAGELLRVAVAAERVEIDPQDASAVIQVTVSIGVAMVRAEDLTLFHTLSRADKALYRAKLGGRDRVESEEGGELVADEIAYTHRSRV